MDLARRLDAPDADPPRPEARRAPGPAPPVAARPRKMSVTRVEAGCATPTPSTPAIVLNLQPAGPARRAGGRPPRGTAIHKALEVFAREWETLGETGAQERFLKRYLAELEAAGMTPAALAREKALAARMADWVAGFERDRRAGGPAGASWRPTWPVVAHRGLHC